MTQWLNYPREFRLLKEMENVSGTINFGPLPGDTSLTKWNGTMMLQNYEREVKFNMECGEDFPTKAPEITLTYARRDIVKGFCDEKNKIKSEFFVWDEKKSIHDNLKPLYAYFDS